MAMGRPKTKYNNNADVHGRLRESRFDVPAGFPFPMGSYDTAQFDRLDDAQRAALVAWIAGNVSSSSAPAISERHILEASDLRVAPGAVRAALNRAGYESPLRDMNNVGAMRYYAKINA
jgi:hypothetical protein